MSEEARAAIAAAGGLVGLADLAKRWGVGKSRVTVLSKREDFPTPVGMLGGNQGVYLVDECDAFRARMGGPGRPANGVR